MTTRSSAIIIVAMSGALALGACGSDATKTGTAATGTAASDCPTGTLKAEGSSAQKNAIEEDRASYDEKCSGTTVNYNPTGSGAGIKQFIAGQVDFAGSDSALKTDDGGFRGLRRSLRLPGLEPADGDRPDRVAYNLEGLDSLVLDADVTADIFSGKITTWNDPAIAALNSGVRPCRRPRSSVFFRSDESGTTENFTKYLKAAAGTAWTASRARSGTERQAGEGKEKSPGVATAVKSVEGGITYVEWSYAKDNKLGIAQIDNGSGPVELTSESVGKFIADGQAEGAPATTSRSSSTTPPRRPGPTRSTW
jgi:phosphate transport system substrate-binding protein